MRIGIFLSTLGGSPLQIGLERGLIELGHWAEPYNPGHEYELVLVFNQSAHQPSYIYPAFPKPDQHIAFIDTAEYGYFKRLPGIAKQYQNLCSPGSLEHDTKNRFQQERLIAYLDGKSFPYFIREYFDFLPWPGGYHPIDYPLYALSVCQDPPSRDEYVKRAKDIFQSWGLSHPWRKQLTESMRGMGLNGDILTCEEHGRMPAPEYFRRMREAKCGVSFDGYGSSSFRVTELLVRSVLLRGPLNIKQYAAPAHGVQCVDYAVFNDGETFLGTNLPDKIAWVLSNQDAAYAIYERGYRHCMEYLTEKAYAAYVLRTVESHDYSLPTKIRL